MRQIAYGTALRPMNTIDIFFDGTFTEPQLNHPECVAVDKDGYVWCGGERGEIFRIDQKGSSIECVASTNGFVLGLAFDEEENLYVCDLKLKTVFRLDQKTRLLAEFADMSQTEHDIRIPNFPVVDDAHGYLYVTDSYDPNCAGPGIWRFDLHTGKGEMWYKLPLRFANGMAFSLKRDAFYVAETFAKRVVRIPVLTNGSPGQPQVVSELDAYPDGLAIGRDGRLFICCYEPSLIYQWSEDEGLQLLCFDETAHTLCHPTNCAFLGNDLLIANLGRWHISRIKSID